MKFYWAIQTTILVFIVMIRPAHAVENVPVFSTVSQRDAYNALQHSTSNLSIVWNHSYNIPQWIRMSDTQKSFTYINLSEGAYQFLETYKALYKMTDPKKEFLITNIQKDALGMTHVTLQQRYNGVEVYAASLQFHFSVDNRLVAVNGTYLPQITLSVTPKLKREQAKELAKENLTSLIKLNHGNLDTSDVKTSTGDLLIYNSGVFSGEQENSQLVWRLSTYSEKLDGSQLYYISANSGNVIKRLENSLDAESRETYVLNDCWDDLGTLTYNEDGLIGPYNSEAETIDQYSNHIYDYYFNKFNRDSYDDLGATLESYSNYSLQGSFYPNCIDYNNASWEPDLRVMRYGQSFLSLDVAGHEFTHGVIQYSVGNTSSDTLEYENESGALNESYADIFGELVEFDSGGGDWLIGTDLPDGPSRDLSNPNNSPDYWQPSNVGEKKELADGESVECDASSTDYNDCGWVHYNSGITNNAFYLLVNGGTNPYSGEGVASGIGIEAAEQIYYRALTTYLDVSSDFEDAYNATMQSCLDLNANDSATYPLSYCEAVFDAFAAVGINTDSSYVWAGISASVTSGYGPLTITFDGADSRVLGSTITNYAWDFDDGSTATGGAVSHTFSDPGSYQVTLTVTAADGNTSDTQLSIVIYPDPTISTNTTWTTDRSPYVITSLTVQSGATLTVDPGVVIKFYDASSNIVINGTLVIDGTATDTVTMTSYQDDTIGGDTNNDGSNTTPTAGDWRSMRVAAGGSLYADYLTMQYGGSSYTAMMLIDDYANTVWLDHNNYLESGYYLLQIDANSTSTVQNSTFTSTAGEYGIYQTGGVLTFTGNTVSSQDDYGFIVYNASPIITNTTFSDSAIGLYVAGASTPNIVNNAFTANEYAIRIDQPTGGLTITGNTGSDNDYNTIAMNGTLSGDQSWNSDNGLLYMIMGSVSVPAGNTLTIDPGTTIKSWDTSSYLSVAGTLQAVGTSGAPIILTSIKDDASGGDSNSDGSATTASAGDWQSINITSGGSAQLDYVTMQYGGHGAAMFLVDDHANTVNIDHSTLQTSAYYVLQIDPDSTSTIQHSTIAGAGSADAMYINGGVATLSGNTIHAVANYALTIVNASPVITDNVFMDSLGGIQVAGASSLPTISANTIYNNSYGIQLGTNANASITNNAITNNSSYGIYSSGPTAVAASSNWWGTGTGPYHATLNPSGTGNAVSDNVDFDPWLSSDPTLPDTTPPSEATLGLIQRDVWNRTITVRWTNPTDADFDHLRIDRTTVSTGATSTLSASTTRTRYTDTTAAYNTNYIYTLYSYDTTGNVSAGVSSSSQRVVNPAPTSLTLTPGDTTITATWSASAAPSASLAGYTVYYGTSPTALTSVVDVGVTTNTTLTGLTNGTLYYVAVTAHSTTGVESGRSPVRSIRPRP
jgi:Zn-dependent metalloprotease